MTDEHPSIHPHEYRHDGLTIHINPALSSLQTRQWKNFESPDTILLQQSFDAIGGLLNRTFLETTLGKQGQKITATTIDVSLIQQGLKNAIYLVTAGENKFVVVQARDANQLSDETAKDFANLNFVHEKLVENGLPVFVPKPLALGEHNGIKAFSVEYLPHHVEVNAYPQKDPLQQLRDSIANPSLTPDADFTHNFAHIFMNGDTPESHAYNDLTTEEKTEKDTFIKEDMLSKLFIIWHLTGQIPGDFKVAAGDFMANPAKQDFDLKLITIRGGFQRVETFEDFIEWTLAVNDTGVMSHSEDVDAPISLIGSSQFPTFDNNEALIHKGTKRGEDMLEQHGIDLGIEE